jgi:hypothetical protein
MTDPITYSAAFLIGLLGGAHCVGMCGGIMGALVMAVPAEKRNAGQLFPMLLCYNIGRISSYCIAGGILGAFGWLLADQFAHAGIILRTFAGLMLVAMGLYLASWWSGLRHLEKAGGALWQKIQPMVKRLMPVETPLHALMIGTLWGWLPCGLLYSALVWAAASANWQEAMNLMLFFGLGTLPAVMATGMFLDKIRSIVQSKGIRSGAAVLVILYGVWTLPVVSSLIMSHGSHQQDGQDHPQHQQEPVMDSHQHIMNSAESGPHRNH